MKIKIIFTAALLLAGLAAQAELKVTVGRNDSDDARPEFKFKNVPAPAGTNAATTAQWSIVGGEKDRNSGGLEKLNDGKLPGEADQPDENFFFDDGGDGGRLLADLGAALAIKEVDSYSWHPGTRGAQVYKLYASDVLADGFQARPPKGTDPVKCGWKLVAKINTRPKGDDFGGQYGVNIADPDGTIGKYRYLLFDVSLTEDDDGFGNTFYSEINIIVQ